VARLKREVASDPRLSTRRRQAAQERAAREAVAKVAKAARGLDRLRQEKAAREKTHPREEKQKEVPSVSLSDLEARRMRFLMERCGRAIICRPRRCPTQD